jgi:hypothetical protein
VSHFDTGSLKVKEVTLGAAPEATVVVVAATVVEVDATVVTVVAIVVTVETEVGAVAPIFRFEDLATAACARFAGVPFSELIDPPLNSIESAFRPNPIVSTSAEVLVYENSKTCFPEPPA